MITFKYSGSWCPLLSNEGLWSERLRWFKSAWDIWRRWYGSLRYVHVVDNASLSLCVCVLQCQNVFPYAFCVCLTEMREDFVVVCRQEVRHSCTRPQLVSVRNPLFFCRNTFLFSFSFLLFPVPGNKQCLFLLYMPYLFFYIIAPLLAHALPHPWLLLWQRGNRAYSPLTASRLIQPPCQSCTRLPKEVGKPCSPLIQQQISGKWKQMKKAAEFSRIENRKRIFLMPSVFFVFL